MAVTIRALSHQKHHAKDNRIQQETATGIYPVTVFYACLMNRLVFFLQESLSCNTQAASSSASARQCKYLFVVSISPCPSRPCTCFKLTPPYNNSVADVCRKAWDFRCSNPWRFRNFENCFVGVQGFIISPFHWVNSQPPSCQYVPNARRCSRFSCSKRSINAMHCGLTSTAFFRR